MSCVEVTGHLSYHTTGVLLIHSVVDQLLRYCFIESSLLRSRDSRGISGRYITLGFDAMCLWSIDISSAVMNPILIFVIATQ